MDKVIGRIFHVSLPLEEAGYQGASAAVSEVRGVDLGDGKRYRVKEVRLVSTKKRRFGCWLQRKNDKGEVEKFRMKETHFDQLVETVLEEILEGEPGNIMEHLTK